MHSARWRTPLALGLLTFAAAALRFWGLHFGLPQRMARPDEEVMTSIIARIIRSGGSPGFFDYPTLFMYAVAFEARTFFHTTDAADPRLFAISRSVAAALGAATVPVLFGVARRLFSTRVAFVASALLAVAFLHVRDSHFGVTDVPATFMAMLAFFVIVSRPLDRAHWWNIVLAAVLCGLAASTKYNAALIAAPLFVAVSLQDRSRWTYGIVAVGMLAAFLAGTPYALLDHEAFVGSVLGVWTHLTSGHLVAQGRGWTHHLTFSLRYGLGLPFLVAAIAGGVWLAVENRRVAALTLVFPVLYYLGIGSGRTVFMRYMMPMVPFAALLAAVAIDRAAALAGRAVGPLVGAGSVLTAVLTIVVGYDSALRAIALDRLLSQTDSRALAATWVHARYPAGVSVHQTGSPYAQMQLDPEGIFPQLPFDAVRGTFVYLDRPTRGPHLVIVLSSRLAAYTPTPPESLRSIIESEYRLAERFDVENQSSAARPVFDQQDAFFLPVAGFDRFVRPGPTIDIYERRDAERRAERRGAAPQ